MSLYVEKFLEKPFSHRLGIASGSLVLVLLGLWYFLLSGANQEAQEVEEKISQLQAEIQNESRLSKNLPKYREQVKELQAKLDTALKELPDKRDIPDLLNSISNLAKEAGLSVSLFKPEPESLKDFYAELPVEINVEGTYHQVASFFDEVGRLPRIVNISNITLKDPVIEKEVGLIPTKVSCLATTFRYLDENERAKTTDTKGSAGNAGAANVVRRK